MQRRDGPLPAEPVTAPPARPGAALDSHFDDLLPDSQRRRPWRTRRRAPSRAEIVVLVLVCAFGLLALARALSLQPTLDARWSVTATDAVELVSSPLPELRGLAGVPLLSLVDDQGRRLDADAELLNRMPRWTVNDAQRARQTEVQLQLHDMLRHGPLLLQFEGGREVRVLPAPRGLSGLGPLFWLLGAVAMALVAVAASVLRLHVSWRNLPYALIGLAQAANLLILAVETLPGLGLPTAVVHHGLFARTAFDLASAAAMVHLSTLLPLRLPGGRGMAAVAWTLCTLLLGWVSRPGSPLAWWWTQAGMLGCGVATIVLMSRSYRLEPNPVALLLRRLAASATATLLLLSLAVAVASVEPRIDPHDACVSTVVWYLFLSTLLLLLPMFARAQPMMRELALLVGTSSIAISLNLLFVAVFPVSAFGSLSISMFFALLVYALTRRWLLQPMRGQHVPGAERMFERLYRVLREVEARPRDSAELLTRLLRDLFEPLQVRTLERSATRSRVLGDGSALLVPLPRIDAEHDSAGTNGGSLVLRFAERGKRMFSRDDARLSDRVVDQLRRAVAYDKAVERGRSEERARIAADLHDDIGARLLTLMYKAQTPEMEDYIRHTLKDLKTLTRGLAASDQRLSHAAAEWKTDIAQRLNAAQIELSWTFHYDRDIVLGVVQWSALTRVLRELVSNVIQHSCATHLEVMATLEGGQLRLSLADDGIGRDPQGWSHGLGLGGVRKRVKLLGGDVQWRENGRAGIVCTVLIPDLGARR